MAVGSGAGLVVAPPGVYAGEPLTALLAQRVSAAVLTPTVLATLDRARLAGLDTLLPVGEACPAELVAGWAPGRRMFNGYGPTETTIWATCCATGRWGSRFASGPRFRGCVRWCWMPGSTRPRSG